MTTLGAAILGALVEVDEWGNAILGGDEEQTISARAYATELAGGDPFWRQTIDKLFFEGHCKGAWEAWMVAQVPKSKT